MAAINADFFNIEESQHPGVQATGSAVGPAISNGEALKAAVPNGQRFGPGLPAGTSTRDVIGVGYNNKARLDELTLDGSVRAQRGRRFELDGLNQYAIPEGGVGAFTAQWGDVSRRRAVCGTDTNRAAACATDAYEVTVRDGRVVSGSETIGSGGIDPDSVVLVGREAGADQLRTLQPGERVRVSDKLRAAEGGRLKFAVGGFPVLRDGRAAPRPGHQGGGHQDRRGHQRPRAAAAPSGPGRERGERGRADRGGTRRCARDVGADAGVNLDGGGSSTLVTRDPVSGAPVVRNHPTGGAERPVPEGIGLFSRG